MLVLVRDFVVPQKLLIVRASPGVIRRRPKEFAGGSIGVSDFPSVIRDNHTLRKCVKEHGALTKRDCFAMSVVNGGRRKDMFPRNSDPCSLSPFARLVSRVLSQFLAHHLHPQAKLLCICQGNSFQRSSLYHGQISIRHTCK